MLLLLIALVAGAGFAWHVLSAAERDRAARTGTAWARDLAAAARTRYAASRDFDATLRPRTPRVLLAPALVALNALICLLVLVEPGSMRDPAVVLSWGGSFGPATTNGEWWRLVTSLFVPAGFFSCLITIVAFAGVGWLLERLTGPVTLAVVYLGAGVLTGLVNLARHPVSVQAGATGAVVGVYGLFAATFIWSLLDRKNLVIPLAALRPLAPAAAVFALYVLLGGLDRLAALAAFATGLVGGLVLTRGIATHKPPTTRLAASVAATAALAIAAAVPLRGLPLVKPEIARVVEIEQRTAESYKRAGSRFAAGYIKKDALVTLIERDILPELKETLARVSSIERVPRQQQQLVADTVDYLRLREASWQSRVDALRASSMAGLRDADRRELAAREAFRKITAAASE